jgi:hypothetical protein
MFSLGTNYHEIVTLSFSVIVLLLLPMGTFYSMASNQTTEFPVGLRLEYRAAQEIDFTTIPLDYYTYVVEGWITENCISMSLTDTDGEHSVSVYLPEWHAFYENGTEYGYIPPLWMDISSWKLHDNVTIATKGTFELFDTRSVTTKAGSYSCWTARRESSAGTYQQYEHYYYSLQYGVLIEHWHSYWHETHVSEDTFSLTSSNLEDYSPLFGSALFSNPITRLLILGIGIEVIIIIGLFLGRRRSNS